MKMSKKTPALTPPTATSAPAKATYIHLAASQTLIDQVTDWQHDNRIKSFAEAIRKLLHLGMARKR